MNITHELLLKLTICQLRHCHKITSEESLKYMSDDGTDSIAAACELAGYLTRINYESDIESLTKLFDDKFDDYAVGGICNEIIFTVVDHKTVTISIDEEALKNMSLPDPDDLNYLPNA